MNVRIGVDRCAVARSQGLLIVDVREPEEYVTGHVPGAVLIPVRQVASRVAELRHQAPVLVICATGNRSRGAVEVLRCRGVEAYSVDGGTTAWINSGRPTITGPHAETA